ncbi:MAG: TM2 domain-containing protein [Planctomycetales bacterium]|nr:TM2 domain-containing protein [Planctomycetales bacterium]
MSSNHETPAELDHFAPVPVDLKSPALAAVLAWLWPGAGHLYQGRKGKGFLYMICILFCFFFGLAIGNGHVVYASFKKEDMRYPYLCQIGVGIPAMPAILQNMSDTPLAGSTIMRQPTPPVLEQRHDEKAVWHEQTGFHFELGTLYTEIAGLLNFLAIYDAYAGPVFLVPERKRRKKQVTAGQGQSGEDASPTPSASSVS